MPDKQEIFILTAVFLTALGLIPVFYIARPRTKPLLLADAGPPPDSIPGISPADLPGLRETEMPLSTDSVYQPPRTEIPVPPPIPDHVRRDWFDWRDAIVAVCCMVFFSFFMGPIGQLLVLFIPKKPGAADAAAVTPEMTFSSGMLAANIVFQFILVAGLIFYLLKVRRLPLLRVFGLKKGPPLQVFLQSLAGLGFCVIAVFAGAALSLAVKAGLGRELSPQPMVKMLTETQDMTFVILAVFTAAVAAPVLEEMFFRGFFFGVGRQYLGTTGAVIVTSLLFGVVHVNLLSFIPLSLIGAVFALAYHKSGNLLVPMFIHAFFNGGQIALMLSGVVPDQN